METSPTYEPDTPLAKQNGGRLSQYFNTAFQEDFSPLPKSSRVFDGLPKLAMVDDDLLCSTARRQMVPDPVLDLTTAAAPSYAPWDYQTSPTIAARSPTLAASPSGEVKRLSKSKLNAADFNIMLTDHFLVRPCLQYDGTTWRSGPKHLSDASAMKRLKMMHVEPSTQKRLLKQKGDELVLLARRMKDLEEDCKMLSVLLGIL